MYYVYSNIKDTSTLPISKSRNSIENENLALYIRKFTIEGEHI